MTHNKDAFPLIRKIMTTQLGIRSIGTRPVNAITSALLEGLAENDLQIVKVTKVERQPFEFCDE